MFAKRPRFDDTFGVRMDLGADRMDPMSLRPSSQAGQLRVKPPVIVETPGSFFGIFRRRYNDPLSALGEKPVPEPAPRTGFEPQRTRAPRDETRSPTRAFEAGVLAIWKRMTPSQRIWLSVVGGMLLFSSGLWIPVAALVVAYFALRRRVA